MSPNLVLIFGIYSILLVFLEKYTAKAKALEFVYFFILSISPILFLTSRFLLAEGSIELSFTSVLDVFSVYFWKFRFSQGLFTLYALILVCMNFFSFKKSENFFTRSSLIITQALLIFMLISDNIPTFIATSFITIFFINYPKLIDVFSKKEMPAKQLVQLGAGYSFVIWSLALISNEVFLTTGNAKLMGGILRDYAANQVLFMGQSLVFWAVLIGCMLITSIRPFRFFDGEIAKHNRMKLLFISSIIVPIFLYKICFLVLTPLFVESENFLIYLSLFVLVIGLVQFNRILKLEIENYLFCFSSIINWMILLSSFMIPGESTILLLCASNILLFTLWYSQTTAHNGRLEFSKLSKVILALVVLCPTGIFFNAVGNFVTNLFSLNSELGICFFLLSFFLAFKFVEKLILKDSFVPKVKSELLIRNMSFIVLSITMILVGYLF